MLIDSHCHLPGLGNLGQAFTQIENAKLNDVVGFINIGTSLEDDLLCIETAAAFKNVFSAVAVYPHENLEISLDKIQQGLRVLIAKSNKVVAVGECGIDLGGDLPGRKLADQLDLFELQIKLALEYSLPLIVHSRNADEHVLNFLEKYRNSGLQGVIHCFCSTWSVAERYLNLGFYISFSAFITYPSKTFLFETVRNVPLDRFVVETDAPFLAPQGMRDKPNEPRNVKIVAQKVADIRNISLEQISGDSFKNTCKLFNLSL